MLEVIRYIESLKPENQLGAKLKKYEFEQAIQAIENFPIELTGPEIQNVKLFRKGFERLVFLDDIGHRDDLIQNGYYIDYILNIYSKNSICFDVCEKYIEEKEISEEQYENAINLITNEDFPSYSTIEKKIKSLEHRW